MRLLSMALLAVAACAAVPTTVVAQSMVVSVTQSSGAPLHRTHPDAASDAPQRMTVNFDVSIDESGHVAALSTRNAVAPVSVREGLDREIRRWTFIPGSIAGKPAPTKTFLDVVVAFEPAGMDKYNVRIVDAHTGGRVGKVRAPPQYPYGALKNRNEGMAVLDVTYDADGHVSNAVAEANAPKPAAELIRAAIETTRKWTFEPETVGERKVAGRMIVPICFTMSVSYKEAINLQCNWVPPGEHSNLADSEAVALAPAARLQTDVIGRTL